MEKSDNGITHLAKKVTLVASAITFSAGIIGYMWSWLVAETIRPEIHRATVEFVVLSQEETRSRIRADSILAESQVVIINSLVAQSADRVRLIRIMETNDIKFRKLLIAELKQVWEEEKQMQEQKLKAKPKIYGRE